MNKVECSLSLVACRCHFMVVRLPICDVIGSLVLSFTFTRFALFSLSFHSLSVLSFLDVLFTHSFTYSVFRLTLLLLIYWAVKVCGTVVRIFLILISNCFQNYSHFSIFLLLTIFFSFLYVVLFRFLSYAHCSFNSFLFLSLF